MTTFVITDIGSTTTKALLLCKDGEKYYLKGRAEAPTTVEVPYEDVTIGVKNALKKLEEKCCVKITDESNLIKPDIEYYSSSSAGGGLQVLVIGLFSKVTAVSAQKAALGAGAIILDVLCNDDKRTLHQRIEIVKRTRPDMILLTGGLNGGDVDYVIEFSDIINSAKPLPRFGETLKLPVIYAGNKDAREIIEDTLSDSFDLHITDNIRPEIDLENLQPAREQLHELFLSHVMQQAPGYNKVTDIVAANIMPTPLAFGNIIIQLAKQKQVNILSMDIGGATTDIFSYIDNNFNRTVSANYGMSYSIANVLQECGLDGIKKYLPFDIDDIDLENIIGEKMLFPTNLPFSFMQLMIEQAVAREAIRLSILHHADLIRNLPSKRDTSLKQLLSDGLASKNWCETDSLVDMNNIDLIIGSGGVLSHAPKRTQAALMLLDSCNPKGLTQLAVDSVFMMPHLGVLAQNHTEIALQLLRDECFIPLGTAISGTGEIPTGKTAARVTISGVKNNAFSVKSGEIKVIELAENETVSIVCEPNSDIDVGRGNGKKLTATVSGGKAGLIFDMRRCSQHNFNKSNTEKFMLATGSYTQTEITEARRLANEIRENY